MKNIKFLGLSALATAMTLTSCDKVEYKDSFNYAFLTSSEAVNGVMYEKGIRWSEQETTMPFVVRMEEGAMTDVVVTLNFDNALVEAYNAANDTDYLMFPQENITFAGDGVTAVDETTFTVTIPAGDFQSVVEMTVERPMSMNPLVEYCVMVNLTSVDGAGMSIAPGAWSSLRCPVFLMPEPDAADDLAADPIPVGKYPSFNWGVGGGINTETVWNTAVNSFTLEMWMNVSGYGQNRAFAANNYPDTPQTREVFIRFGDANTINGGYNYTEVKAFGGSAKYSPAIWEANKWFHIAISYERETNVFTIYRNGEIIYTITDCPEPRADIDNGRIVWHGFCMFTGYSGAKAGIRDLRFWNVARTQDRIKAAMRLRSDINEPNLIAYWPFDYNGTGDAPTTFPELTGKNVYGVSEERKVPAMKLLGGAGVFAGWSADDVDFANEGLTE